MATGHFCVGHANNVNPDRPQRIITRFVNSRSRIVFWTVDLNRERRAARVIEQEINAPRAAAVGDAGRLEHPVQWRLRREPVASVLSECLWYPFVQEPRFLAGLEQRIARSGIKAEGGIENEGYPLGGDRQDRGGFNSRHIARPRPPSDLWTIWTELGHMIQQAVSVQRCPFHVERRKRRPAATQDLEKQGARQPRIGRAAAGAVTTREQDALAEDLPQPSVAAQSVAKNSRHRADRQVLGNEVGTRCAFCPLDW